MTDQELKDLVASLAIKSDRTDEQMKANSEEMRKTGEYIKATSEEIKKTDKKLKEVSSQLGNIGKNQGDVAEEFFVNSIASTLKVGGVQYDELHQNMAKRTKKLQGEFDIVLVNGRELLIIETKYKAHSNDLDDLINKRHINFKKLYPQYDDYVQHLGLASFYINDDTKEKALNSNVMILQRKGDIVETILPLS